MTISVFQFNFQLLNSLETIILHFTINTIIFKENKNLMLL